MAIQKVTQWCLVRFLCGSTFPRSTFNTKKSVLRALILSVRRSIVTEHPGVKLQWWENASDRHNQIQIIIIIVLLFLVNKKRRKREKKRQADCPGPVWQGRHHLVETTSFGQNRVQSERVRWGWLSIWEYNISQICVVSKKTLFPATLKERKHRLLTS